MLALSSANAFKVRAFENAARYLDASGLPLAKLVAFPPKGFGKGLLEKLDEFQRTCGIAELETLKASFPPGLFDLMRVQGQARKKWKFFSMN